MKFAFLFILVLLQGLLFSQKDILRNSNYPYKYMPAQDASSLMPGNYLLRTDADYFNILNPDMFHPNQMPATSLYNDFGMVLKRNDGSLFIDSIVETNDNVIIYTRIITSNYCYMPICRPAIYSYTPIYGPAVFIRLKKTNKEILISETPIEEVAIDKPGIVRIKLN